MAWLAEICVKHPANSTGTWEEFFQQAELLKFLLDVNSLFGQDATSLYSGSEVVGAMQIVCLHLFLLPLEALCSFWVFLTYQA